jgi:hypothetical protein
MVETPSTSTSTKKSTTEALIEMLRKDEAMQNELPKIEKIVENVFSHILELDNQKLLKGEIPSLDPKEKKIEVDDTEIPLYNNIFRCLNKMFLSHFESGVVSNQVDDKTNLMLKTGLGSLNLADYISKIFFEELRARGLVPNSTAKAISSTSILPTSPSKVTNSVIIATNHTPSKNTSK